MRILFSANILQEHQKKLKSTFPNEELVFYNSIAEVKQHLPTAEVLVTFGKDLTSELIDEALKLKWIMVLSAGIDEIPFEKTKEKKILVTSAQGIHKVPMAEYVISMLLQVYRKEKTSIENEIYKKWDRSYRNEILEISDKTMLIIGSGSIGQEVARLAKAFNMVTYGVSRSGRKAEHFDYNYRIENLTELLNKADFIISVLPSTIETRELFTLDIFKKMNKDAIFLNMGRGDVLKESDLLTAVQSQEISHAVLDVFLEEPLPEEHPFWQEENITITPHLSGVSTMYQPRSLQIFEKNLCTFINGGNDFINQVDIKKGY